MDSSSPDLQVREAPALRLSLYTLAPVAALCAASSLAAAVLAAWHVGSSKDDEIARIRLALQASQARAQVLEVLALNGMGTEQAREAVALLSSSSAPALAGPVSGTPRPPQVSAVPGASGLPQSPPVPAAKTWMDSRQVPNVVAAGTATFPGLGGAPSRGGVASPVNPSAQAGSPSPSTVVQVPVLAQGKPLPSAAAAPAQWVATPVSAATGPAGAGANAAPGEQASDSSAGQQATTAPAPSPAPAGKATAPSVPSVPTAGSSADRVMLVPAQVLGVARVEQGAVVMLSGKRVKVGETFESGEVLREADPVKNRIVTDQRTVGLL